MNRRIQHKEFERSSLFPKKSQDYIVSTDNTKKKIEIPNSQVSFLQKNSEKYNLNLEDLFHGSQKQNICKSLSSSEAKYSQQNLSSLMNLSECCFPEPNLDDFETKVKFFALEKLPKLFENIQPSEISKVVLIMSTILISNRIPKKKLKLNRKQKTIIKHMIKNGLGKEISSK